MLNDSTVFQNNAEGRKIYVPIESVETYVSAEYWDYYAEYIVGYNYNVGDDEPDDETMPKKNEIWYTTSDNKPIELYQTMGFSANIVSNTYDNERGVIVFDKDISAISEYAFYGCTKLTSIQMPSSVAEIKDYAFSNTSISEISIPVNVTIIADGAFEYCDNITTIDIPNNVALVGDYAFNGCENLQNITFGDSVTVIGNYAFANCNKVRSIVIPECIDTIGEKAFYTYSDCITTVFLRATNPPDIGSNSFSNNDKLKIYVPRVSYSSYTGWWSSTDDDGVSVVNWNKYGSYVAAYDF